VNDNRGEIACGNPKGLGGYGDRLALTVKKFEQILKVNIESIEERFTSVINFGFLNQAKVRGQYFVGEAAGFQDHLAGFGMGYAFKSGYYAARSISESVEYDRLWQEDFLKFLKVSSRNRWIYDRLSNEDFERFVDILRSRNPLVTHLRGGDDMRFIMRTLYNTPVSLFHAYFMARSILRSFDIRRIRHS
jgi:flavin-dependent dehydrogenase